MFVAHLQLGFRHVIPLGLDHILFMICLVLQNKRLTSIIYKSLLFTISHSLALLLAVVYHIPNYSLTEPLIALTILVSAMWILLDQVPSKINLLLIFIFGIIHGLGFANAFMEAGVDSVLISVLSFNVGVELAQLCILLGGYGLFHMLLSEMKNYNEWIVKPVCTLIACIAVYWFLTRLPIFQ